MYAPGHFSSFTSKGGDASIYFSEIWSFGFISLFYQHFDIYRQSKLSGSEASIHHLAEGPKLPSLISFTTHRFKPFEESKLCPWHSAVHTALPSIHLHWLAQKWAGYQAELMKETCWGCWSTVMFSLPPSLDMGVFRTRASCRNAPKTTNQQITPTHNKKVN